MAVTVTIDDIKRVYKAFEELAVEEYRELIDKMPKGKDKPFQSLLLLGDVRTAFLHIIESREDVWQEAQGRAEEVAQMFQLPEGIPDADEVDACPMSTNWTGIAHTATATPNPRARTSCIPSAATRNCVSMRRSPERQAEGA